MMLGSSLKPIRWLPRAGALWAALVIGLAVAAPRPAEALPVGDLWISEVMYNPSGGDDGDEWVELFNAGPTPIDLSNYSLGWGGTDYIPAAQLVGTIAPGDYFVVGGPNSYPGNGNPTYDQVLNFTPNLENGGVLADGVALFDLPAVNVVATTVPTHAVIYRGLVNLFLMDESGGTGDIDVPWGPPAAGESIEFDGAVWGAQGTPSPGSGNLPVPETAPSLLMMLGLAGLAAKGTRRHRARARRRSS